MGRRGRRPLHISFILQAGERPETHRSYKSKRVYERIVIALPLAQRQGTRKAPLQKQIFVGEPALWLPQFPSHLNWRARAPHTYRGYNKRLWCFPDGAHCAPLQCSERHLIDPRTAKGGPCIYLSILRANRDCAAANSAAQFISVHKADIIIMH